MNHGTHVAGIIAAGFNNGKGISGVCPKNNLYAFSMLIENANKYDDDTLKKIHIMQYKAAFSKFAKKDVKVINISMGYTSKVIGEILSQNKETIERVKEIEASIKFSLEKQFKKGYDFVIVTAAGNNNINTEYNTFLHTIDDADVKNHIIVVGAISRSDDTNYKIWYEDDDSGSNYGERVDVLAPGTEIISTDPGKATSNAEASNMYYWVNQTGTSFAAPHVSGIAGMMYSVNPNISGFEVKEIIKTTSQLRKVADNHGYEYGIADAKLAVSTAYYCNPDNADKIIFGKLKDFNDTSKVYSNTELKVSYSYNGFITTSIISSDENGEFELVVPKDLEIPNLNIQVNGYDVTNIDILGQFFGGSAVIDTYITPIEASIYGKVTVKNLTKNEITPKTGHTVKILKDGEDFTSVTTQADGTYKAQVNEYGLYTIVFDEKHQYEVYIGMNMDYEINCEFECDDEEDDTKLSGTGARLHYIITYEDNCDLCQYFDCEYIQIEEIEDEWPVFILLENVVYSYAYGSVELKEEAHYEDNPVDYRFDTMRWEMNNINKYSYYYDIKTIEIHLTGTIYDSEGNLCSDSIIFSKGNSVESHAVFVV